MRSQITAAVAQMRKGLINELRKVGINSTEITGILSNEADNYAEIFSAVATASGPRAKLLPLMV
jgi:hypothetical protein